MLTYRNSRFAFTLLEVLIVVVIIGLIASMVMPQFQKMIEEAKIREAKSVLRAIRGGQKVFKARTTTYVGVHIDPGIHGAQDNCPATGGPCTKADAWDILSIGVDDSADWSYGANVLSPPESDCNAPDGMWGISDNNRTVIPWARRESGPNAGQVVHIQMTSGDFIPATGLDASIVVDCTQQR